jgi:serine/threonine protein kinase
LRAAGCIKSWLAKIKKMIDENFSPDTENWQKLNELFAAAIELEPAAQSDFLRRIENKNLRREVEKILAATSRAEAKNFLRENALQVGTQILANGDDAPLKTGTRIGNYKIVREIGRGGMGAVFLAEREDFRRTVALKIIKRGMDTDDIIRRFRQEREVLASLNHSNIAKLLDGGTTDDATPYFVMEYVEGSPVTEFCDRKKLNIEERLELFRKICAAVAYAHQNLIVHRDIKPSNILVDKAGEPKLLDFGISKLLASDEAEKTETAAEVRLMTPEYASPEQIRGEKITTVSDIYSLGVLLYELLSGHRPLKLKNHSSLEILKIVAEQEPSAPSTAALTAEEIVKGETKEILSPKTIADARSEKPERLRRRLRGDLDNIVLMSLRKEPSRRYSSVEQFSEDLRRHLEGLPVLARPATFGYTVSKFVQRNRAAAAAVSIALLLILAALSFAIWEAVEARREKERAERRFNDVRKLANQIVSGWDKDLKDVPVPAQVRGCLADISAEYLENLTRETGDNDAALWRELAEAHIALGHQYAYQLINVEKAESSFRKSEEIARRLIAAAPDDVDAKELLSLSLMKYDEFFAERDREASLQGLLENLRLREEILAARPEDEQALKKTGQAADGCGLTLQVLGRRDEALNYFRLAAEFYERRVKVLESTANAPEDRAQIAWALMSVASMYGEHLNENVPAIESSRHAFEIARAVHAEKPDDETIVSAAYEYGLALKRADRHADAVEAFRVAAEKARLFQKGDSTAYFTGKEFRSVAEIAESLNELGETEKAFQAAKESLERRRKWMRDLGSLSGAEQTWRHGIFFHSGGRLLVRMKKPDEAEKVFLEAEQAFLKVLELAPDKITLRHDLFNNGRFLRRSRRVQL